MNERTRFIVGSIGRVLVEEFGDVARVEKALKAAGVSPNEVFSDSDRRSLRQAAAADESELLDVMRRTIKVEWPRFEPGRMRVSEFLKLYFIENGIWDHPLFSERVLRKYDSRLCQAYTLATVAEAVAKRPLDDLHLGNHGRPRLTREEREKVWAELAHLQPAEKERVSAKELNRRRQARRREKMRALRSAPPSA